MYLLVVMMSLVALVAPSPQNPYPPQDNQSPYRTEGQNGRGSFENPTYGSDQGRYKPPVEGQYPPAEAGAYPGYNPDFPKAGEPGSVPQDAIYPNRPFTGQAEPDQWKRPFDSRNRDGEFDRPTGNNNNNNEERRPGTGPPGTPTNGYEPSNRLDNFGQSTRYGEPNNQNGYGQRPPYERPERPGYPENTYEGTDNERNNETTENPDTVEANVTTTSTPQNSSDSDTSDSLADFVIEKISDLVDQKDDEKVETGSKKLGMNEECMKDMVLNNVCSDITTEANIHFGGDLSLKRIAEDMFDPSTLAALSGCEHGAWCLDDIYHDTIKASGWKFNDIYCVNVSEWSMRGCLNKLQQWYPNCMDKEIDFVYKSINLLCSMWDTNFMENECYTRTKKSLYVLLRELHERGEDQVDMTKCDSYSIELMRTYLCADDACHYDQQQMLLSFPPFTTMVDYPDTELARCNMSLDLECQGEDSRGDYYYDYNEMYNDYEDEDEDTSYEDNMKDIIADIMGTVKGATSPSEPTNLDDVTFFDSGELTAQDKALFVGLVVAVVLLATGFLILLVLGFRRLRRGIPEGGYPVYTKLASDEEVSGMRAQF